MLPFLQAQQLLVRNYGTYIITPDGAGAGAAAAAAVPDGVAAAAATALASTTAAEAAAMESSWSLQGTDGCIPGFLCCAAVACCSACKQSHTTNVRVMVLCK